MLNLQKTTTNKTAMLDRIIRTKLAQLELIDIKAEIIRLKKQAASLPPVNSLAKVLRHDSDLSIIAEIKRKSPSKGVLNASLDVATFASEYQSSGAKAISVLTESEFFDGSLDDLAIARQNVTCPILRKDFIINEYQVWKSRVAGADALLLIASCLNRERLSQLIEVCNMAGIEALIEVHTESELKTVLDLKPKLIAVNNRDLRTFEVDPDTMSRFAPLIPKEIVTVSASGVRNYDDMTELKKLNIDAVLIGEAIVTADNPGHKIRELLGK